MSFDHANIRHYFYFSKQISKNGVRTQQILTYINKPDVCQHLLFMRLVYLLLK